jgi:predicted transcriptional regulator of viral defense system
VNKNTPVYLDYIYMMDNLKEYSSPKSKLTTMIKSGEIIKVRRGLYLPGDRESYSLKTLANKIYGPSYISFEYALSYYNLIPERTDVITSASLDKKKNKLFKTPFGSFLYRSVIKDVYPFGIVRIEEDGNPFLIATKEKALCDYLSKMKAKITGKSIRSLLFDDLRIDEEEIRKLDIDALTQLAPLYRKKSLKVLLEFIKEEILDA